MSKRFCLLLIACLLLPGGAEPAGTAVSRQLKAVDLVFKGPARSVCISGDFNQWSPARHCMNAHADGWRLTLLLAPGIYRYAFFVDGSRWVRDPSALWTEEDGFGRRNSILVVP